MDCKKYFKIHGLNLTKHDRVLGIWNWKLKFLVSIFFLFISQVQNVPPEESTTYHG